MFDVYTFPEEITSHRITDIVYIPKTEFFQSFSYLTPNALTIPKNTNLGENKDAVSLSNEIDGDDLGTLTHLHAIPQGLNGPIDLGEIELNPSYIVEID